VTVGNGTLGALSSSLDGKTWTGTFTPTANTEGSTNVVTVTGAYTDSAGNAGATGTSSTNYSVDTKAPTATVTSVSVAGDNILNIAEADEVHEYAFVEVTGTVTGTLGEGEQVTLTVGDEPYFTTSLVGGTFTINVAASVLNAASSVTASITDAAGNSSTPVTRTYTIDTTAPEAGTLGATDVTDSGFKLAVTGNESGATVKYQSFDSDNSTDRPGLTPDTVSVLTEGTSLYRAVVTDAAGNSANTAAIKVFVGNNAANTLAGDNTSGLIIGRAGNDAIDGGAGADTIFGGDGNDTIAGKAGNDTITGGAGNDAIDGGADTDTVVFSGARSNYKITLSGSTYTVEDISNGTPDGKDTVTGVENFNFASGGTLTTGQLDLDAPTISSIDFGTHDGTIKAGEPVDLIVTFNEAVTVTGTPTLTLSNGGTATYASGSGGAALTFHYTASAGQDNSHSEDTSDINVRSYNLTADGASVRDAQGNFADITNASTNPTSVEAVDTTPPTPGTLGVANINNGFDLVVSGAEDGATFTYIREQFVDNVWGDLTALDNEHVGSLDPGTYRFTAVVTDAANNSATTGPFSVIVGNDEGQETTGVSDTENLIIGFGGKDTIHGTANSDTIFGGAGDDTIDGGSGASPDVINGGADIDTVTYVNSTEGVTVSLGGGGVGGDADGDTLTDVENLTGSNSTDALTGNGDANVISGLGDGDNINGGAGNDTLIGGAGNDTINGGGGENDTVVFSGVRADYVITLNNNRYTIADTRTEGSDGTDTVSDIDSFRFGGIDGESKDAAGFDLNPTVKVEIADASLRHNHRESSVTFTFSEEVSAQTVANLASGAGITVTGGTLSALTCQGNVIATATFTADDNSTTTGSVAVAAGSYTDKPELDKAALAGTAGSDSVTIDTANPAAGTLSFTNAGNVYGLSLTGQESGAGVVYQLSTDNGAHWTDTTASPTGLAGGSYQFHAVVTDTAGNSVTTAPVSVVIGSSTVHDLVGSDQQDTIVGQDGNDVLNGGAGADTMAGGGGNDTYVIDDAGDIVDEGGSTGVDTVQASVSFSLADTIHALGTIENLILTGTGNINATGNALNNMLTGNTGANILDGAAGADTMSGLGGNDIYVVDNAGDIVNESIAGSNGIDTVQASISFSLADSIHVKGTFENLTLTGLGNINGTGNGLNNALTGNAGINVLNGGGGNDVLNGGAGKDTLIGGAGKDTFLFNSALSATKNIDKITDFSVPNDTIQLENDIFKTLTKTGRLASAAFYTGAAAHDGNDHIIYNPKTGALIYDANGNKAGGAVQFATLAHGLHLTAADFVVV
jgi:Ca2+-binding RTX toxin-like protein